MLDIYLPFILGLMLGISPPQSETVEVAAAPEVATIGSGDDAGDRTPEEQIPTGQFTTAVEVKPILGMTKGNWAAVRNYEGQDLVYFTHLLSWRCGLWDIRYGVNGAPASETLVMEPCNTNVAQPNAMIDVATYRPYVIFPGDFVTSIYVEVTFDDGTVDFARFNRQDILIP